MLKGKVMNIPNLTMNDKFFLLHHVCLALKFLLELKEMVQVHTFNSLININTGMFDTHNPKYLCDDQRRRKEKSIHSHCDDGRALFTFFIVYSVQNPVSPSTWR